MLPGGAGGLFNDDSRQERWDVFELRSLLGIVSNDLMSKCTGKACGRDVVLSGFFSSTRIFPHHHVDPGHRKLADGALTQLQISHLAERPVAEMSSGEARRVLIARALVHKPRALLFDEPSNSLDVFARQSLRQTMSSLARAGIGIILVTHDLSDLIRKSNASYSCRTGASSLKDPKTGCFSRSIWKNCLESRWKWRGTTVITIYGEASETPWRFSELDRFFASVAFSGVLKSRIDSSSPPYSG